MTHIDLYFSSRPRNSWRIAPSFFSGKGREYEIGDRLGAGGNAVVYECIDRIDGDTYAVKFQLILSEKRKQRFTKEIELHQQLTHSQLMSYVDHGEIRGIQMPEKKDVIIPFLIMPIADKNLRDVIKTDGQMPLPEEYIAQFKGLAEALGVLHQKAVHRDIKPENILVKGETWLLSDFGLCEVFGSGDDLTSADEVIGPRYWMSPEAINKAVGNTDAISKRSDVFQLGSVFWFVATGRHPSGNVTETDWTGPKNLFPVLVNALSHNQAQRPADGVELAKLIDAAVMAR